MPHFLDAARARASEGEMVASLQQVFGTYTEAAHLLGSLAVGVDDQDEVAERRSLGAGQEHAADMAPAGLGARHLAGALASQPAGHQPLPMSPVQIENVVHDPASFGTPRSGVVCGQNPSRTKKSLLNYG